MFCGIMQGIRQETGRYGAEGTLRHNLDLSVEYEDVVWYGALRAAGL